MEPMRMNLAAGKNSCRCVFSMKRVLICAESSAIFIRSKDSLINGSVYFFLSNLSLTILLPMVGCFSVSRLRRRLAIISA